MACDIWMHTNKQTTAVDSGFISLMCVCTFEYVSNFIENTFTFV